MYSVDTEKKTGTRYISKQPFSVTQMLQAACSNKELLVNPTIGWMDGCCFSNHMFTSKWSLCMADHVASQFLFLLSVLLQQELKPRQTSKCWCQNCQSEYFSTATLWFNSQVSSCSPYLEHISAARAASPTLECVYAQQRFRFFASVVSIYQTSVLHAQEATWL